MATSAAEAVRESWIKWALSAFDESRDRYRTYEDYYLGDHELAFSTERWEATFSNMFEEFADNFCKVVVDAVAQRMKIVGWDSSDKGVAKEADECWKDTDLVLPREGRDVIRQSLIKGDSYLICWPDPEKPNESVPQAFFNDALNVEVLYDRNNSRKLARGIKRWTDLNSNQHLRVYLPNRVESYIAKSNFDPAMAAQMLTMTGTPEELAALGWEKEQADILNPYGMVPIFHFRNDPIGTHGVSEIKIAIPIQNAINKVLMDMLLASEFGGYTQKWMAGAGHPKGGWKGGPERIWATTDQNAKFGSFDVTPLEPYTRTVDTLVAQLGKTTQTPMHYLRTSGDMPSGEALKTAESGLVHKCEDKAEEWKWTWAYAMDFILRIKTGNKPKALAFPVWDAFDTRHDLEQAQVAQLKAILGVPLKQVLREHFSYTDEQLDEFMTQNKLIITQTLQQVLAQNGQLPPGLEDVGSLSIPQLLAALPKGITSQTAAGETTTRPQPNTRPAPSPTRRSSGFKD